MLYDEMVVAVNGLLERVEKLEIESEKRRISERGVLEKAHDEVGSEQHNERVGS